MLPTKSTNQLWALFRNVYKEPLKKCQVEGCLLTVEPDLLFGNLDQLCRISRGFCQTFLTLLQPVNREGTDYDCTDLVVKLFEKVRALPTLFNSLSPVFRKSSSTRSSPFA